MAKMRTDFRAGPFRITGSPALAIILGLAVLILCGVLPCIVGSLAL